MKSRKIDSSTLKWIINMVGKDGKKLLLLLGITLLESLEPTLFTFALKNIIDCALAGDRESLIYHFIIISLIVIASIGLYTARFYMTEKLRVIFVTSFRRKIFSKIISRKYENISKIHTGQWMTLLTSDADIVAKQLVTIPVEALSFFTRCVGAFCALFVMLPQAAWILIPGGMAMVVISLCMRWKIKKIQTSVQKADGEVRSFFQEHLACISVIKAFVRMSNTINGAEVSLRNWEKQCYKKAKFTSACAGAIICMVKGVYLVGIIISNVYIFRGLLSYGEMVAVLQLIRQAEAPFAEVAGLYPQFFAMIASAERLMKIGELPHETNVQVKNKEEIHDFYDNAFWAVGFRQAAFWYDTEKILLYDFNFEIHKGEFVAFVGESGCGKSTTLKLLLNLHELKSGCSYVVEKNGKEQPLTADWRALFAYIPQGNYLFSGTIRDIISFHESIEDGAEVRTIQERGIRLASDIACASEFIDDLPDGLDTILGERGTGLSEGQMQRIAIARAIYSECPILLLDEATSALDQMTEKQLLRNLKEMTDKTVIFVTHRASALAICNRTVTFAPHNSL